MLARVETEWLEATEFPTSFPCPASDSLAAGETLITWSAETEIRAGDLVALEFCEGGFCRTVYRRAAACGEKINIMPNCDLPPLRVVPGAPTASNGFLNLRILGIVRGTYLAF